MQDWYRPSPDGPHTLRMTYLYVLFSVFGLIKSKQPQRKVFLPVGKREEEIGPWAKAFGLLSVADKAIHSWPDSLFPTNPLWLCPELLCLLGYLCASAHGASAALERHCELFSLSQGALPTFTSSFARGFLTGCHWPCWAAAAIWARGVQLGIKTLTITITGLIELKVFRVIFQVNSMEIIFTTLANKINRFLMHVKCFAVRICLYVYHCFLFHCLQRYEVSRANAVFPSSR